MRASPQHHYIDDIEASWEDKYEKEGPNDNLKSTAKEYDSIPTLHTPRGHFDRILGEEAIFVSQCDNCSQEEE